MSKSLIFAGCIVLASLSTACANTTVDTIVAEGDQYFAVYLSQDIASANGPTEDKLWAWNAAYDLTAATPPLEQDESGACKLVVHSTTDTSAPDPSVTLGKVTVTGAALPANGLLLQPENTFENPLTSPLRAWSGGEDLTFSAAGGTLPAFSGKHLTTPVEIQLSAPVIDPVLEIDRSVDLPVHWTGGGEGIVAVTLFTRDETTQRHATVACEFPVGDGQGTVPAALLSHLAKAGDAGIKGTLNVTPVNTSAFLDGDREVRLTVAGSMLIGSVHVTN